jgi:hypothetical protein
MTPAVYAKARSEIVALFGWDADSLTPDQMLRLDCAVALRLALDELQSRVIRGESVDMNRMLTASEALARLLPPAVLSAPPPAQRSDPHEAFLRRYLEMRERGGIPDEGMLQGTINAQAREIEELHAEVARWRASVWPAPEPSSVPSARPAASAVPTPAEPPKPVPNAPVVARPGWQTKEQMDAANARAAAALASAAPHKTNPWDAAGGRSAFTVNGQSEPWCGFLRADGSWAEF